MKEFKDIAERTVLDRTGWKIQEGLVRAILSEQETIIIPVWLGPETPGWSEKGFTAKIKRAEKMIRKVDCWQPKDKTCLAFSGGDDSLVLLDLVLETVVDAPTIIWADTQMEYPGSETFIRDTLNHYYKKRYEGLDLRIARARQTPLEQWEKTGWPMLGKTAARFWNQRHTGLGFRLNVSECCRAMKIGPARAVARNLGCTLQFTGKRGQADDNLRGMRTIKDGSLFFQERDKLWICNPLTGWTDADIAAYIKAHPIVRHPARALGAQTIGCVFCGGGSQYTNSGYRFLRHIWPEAWRQFMIDWRGGEIILALKYKTSLNRIQEAIAAAGGLKGLAAERPWIFDFTRLTPIKGYRK
jgi:3'-phosphoadenosine 5'-phosphosulfate sulfotransferase (PAPS reductase)/FAD synthetase